MQKRKERISRGLHFKSLKTILILIIFGLSASASITLGALGRKFLQQSLLEHLETYKESMYEGYYREIKSQIQSCIGILESYYNRSQSGELTMKEAQEMAKEEIRVMRYREDGSGYMWIDDTDYNLVMHPILPEQEGNNRYDLTDQNGVKIIQNIMKSAQAGGGYNEFYFTKADGVTVAPKISYSEIFTLGTGLSQPAIMWMIWKQKSALRKGLFRKTLLPRPPVICLPLLLVLWDP